MQDLQKRATYPATSFLSPLCWHRPASPDGSLPCWSARRV